MPRSIADVVRRLLVTRPPRAKSLVVSVFGDAVVPHGGLVWIGTLIRWLAGFGPNERAVRTAVQRLCADGWLESRSSGRRSDYGLTPLGRHTFADAERRIYAAETPAWAGNWCLVLLPPASIEGRKREAARKALAWHGFGEISPAALLHPEADAEELRLVLADLGLDGRAIVLGARGDSRLPLAPQALRSLVGSAWDLRHLEKDYANYVTRFAPLARRLAAEAPPASELAFRIQVLAIHEYRRVVLRDPELPAELLPRDWIGHEARRVCRDVYLRVAQSAEEYVRASGETSRGPLPAAEPWQRRRFEVAGRD